MSAALRGNLRDFGIAEVFQLVGQQRKTGVLEIEHSGRTLCIQFDKGSVVVGEPRGATDHAALAGMLVRCGLLTRERADAIGRDSAASARSYRTVAAESGDVSDDEIEQIVDLLTQDVIFEVLRFKSGSFHFSSVRVEHDRPPERLLGAEQILMDGLRMVDEWQTFAAKVPNSGAVVRRSGTLERYRKWAIDEGRETRARAERVFQLVDGRLTIGRIVDLARVGTFEGTRAIAALLEASSIEITESVLPSVAVSASRSAASVMSGLRVALAAGLPLALLAGVIWLGGQQLVVPSPVPGTAIQPRALEQAVAAFETRRLRHALEAHRHLWSHWPPDLASVDRTGWSGSGALAAPEVDSYYYAHRGDGVLLLPPEPGTAR